jgi:hypothetical protein
MRRALRSPAQAGVQQPVPDWTPAFAGEQFRAATGVPAG